MFWTMAVLTLVTGVSLGYHVGAERTLARLRPEVDRERARADEATNRLLSAWKEGYVIPEPVHDPIDEEPLPPALAEWLTQWEDPTAREKFEADLRRKLAQGRTPDQILMDLELAS